MAGLAIASSGLTLAGEIGSYLRLYRQRWNQTAQQIADFERLNCQLADRQADWTQMLHDYGLRNDHGLRIRFERASRHLDEERQRFSRLQNNWCLSFWTKAQASPEILTNSINRLINDFEKIPKFLRDQEDETRMLANRAIDTPDSLGFGLDPRIVRLQEMEDKVMKELKDFTPEANQIVNLYGELGSGKTCLAKSIAYQIHHAVNDMRSLASSSTHTSITENNTMFQDGAVFLTCDPEAKDCGKLCGEILSKIKARGQDACVDKELSEKLRIMRKRLSTKHVLIVFDNVMNHAQIKDLLVSEATGVKYLLTSPQKDVWPDAKCVLMDKPTTQEAHKILARRAKMPNDEIPQNLRWLVNALIDQVGYNLLGLALILETMKDPLQKKYWDIALDDFKKTVDDASFIHDKHVVAFGQPYPHTLSVAMLMALKGLHDKARDLLYLLALFGGDGVPEPLLGLAFRASHPKLLPGDFVRAWDELAEHDLIQVERHIDPVDRFERQTCVLNPTRRFLIRKKKQGEVSAKLIALLNNSVFKDDNEERDVLVAILCLFYIFHFLAMHADENQFLTEEASQKMEEARRVLKLKRVTEESGRSYVNLIWVLEPLMHLLDLSTTGEGSKVQCRELARKVIMNYIQKGQLDDKIISQLLQIQQTFFVTCDFLWTAFSFGLSSTMTNQTVVFEQEIEGEVNDKNKVLEQTPMVLLNKYMDLLHLANSGKHLERIKYIISCMLNMKNCDYVFEHTSLLEKIENIRSDTHNEKQGLALLKLFRSSTARKTIVDHPYLLDSFISLVYQLDPCDIQEYDIDIVRALCGFIYEIPTVATKMVTFPCSITKLFNSISEKRARNVHEIYFRELLNLVGIVARAMFKIDKNKSKNVFASAPGILEMLLSYHNDSLTIEQQKSTIKALTLIYHAKGNAFTKNLTSPYLFEARGEANLMLELYKEALADFEAAVNDYKIDKWKQKTCILRCVFCKIKLKEYEGALRVADNVVTCFKELPFTFQERGVVKEMMEDYEGAIEDLTEALRLNSRPQYECLKHRAYARFKLGFPIEACQDAEMANQLGVPDDVEESINRGMMSLSILPVPEFLGYNLT